MIRLVPPLGDDAFEPHGAGMMERALAVIPFDVIRQLNAVTGAT